MGPPPIAYKYFNSLNARIVFRRQTQILKSKLETKVDHRAVRVNLGDFVARGVARAEI